MWRLVAVVDGKYVFQWWRPAPALLALMWRLGSSARTAIVQTDEFAWIPREEFWGGRA